MTMTEEMLRERLILLQQDQENAKAQLYGCQGAIQECEYWLKQVIKAPPQDIHAPADTESD